MVVKFVDAKVKYGRRNGIKEGYEYIRASDLVGKTFVIEDVDIIDGKFGKTAVVYMDNGRYFMTTSRILMEQIENVIKPLIDKGETVEASLIQAKSARGIKYYTFA